MKKIILGIALAFSIALGFTSNVTRADSTVVISDNTSISENSPGWMFNRDVSTSTPYVFSTGAASIGTGSLYVQPIGATPANKFVGEFFMNKPIADVDLITYDFKIGSGGLATQEEQFYMSVYINFGASDDFKFYDCRYSIVPTVGSTGAFTTVAFNPTLAYPVTTRTGVNASPFTCPAIPVDMDTLSPGSNLRMFSLNVGDTSASDVGLDGYLDKVVVDISEDATTYDFELVEPSVSPTPTPTPNPFAVPAECSAITGLGAPIVGTASSDNINGTSGNDLIFALGGSDRVNGKGGADCIVGGGGSDKLIGGTGNDVILGGDGSDSLQGNDGADKLYGGNGSDSLKGGNQNDMLWGGNDSDSLHGDSGNDTLDGESGIDSAKGGTGTDTCTAESVRQCEI